MSGCGRKHRAKHLTQQFLDTTAWQGLKAGEGLGVCMASPQGQHVRVLLLMPAETADGVAAASQTVDLLPPVETLVLLPGKFRKVIWLSIKDVVVVADGAVHFKPSAEQLGNFLRDPAHAVWAAAVRAAQKRAEEERRGMERLPLHIHMSTTTTSALPDMSAGDDAAASLGVTAEDGRQHDEGEAATAALDEMVNPNRQNIRHRRQFFYGEQDEEGEAEDSHGDEA